VGLKDKISADMKEAMRAKDKARLGTIRMLQAAIQRREVDERIELDDNGVLAIVEKIIKQSRDAADQFTQGNRPELAEKEMADIAVWEQYLPAQLDEAEVDAMIEQAISDTGAQGMKEMGKVMGQLKPKLQGKTDMGAVSAKIKTRLSN
jgi:uncharacterized protein YqeY